MAASDGADGRVRRLVRAGGPVIRVLLLALVLVSVRGTIAVIDGPGPGKPTLPARPPDPEPELLEPIRSPLVVEAAHEVARIAGVGSRDRTGDRYGVHGTDLGHMFRYGDDLRMVFGDTFGARGGDWRSNVMAVIEDTDPTHGLPITDFVTDDDGRARELLPSAKVDGEEMTVIPTHGTAVGDRMVLHYMSVRTWGAPGEWEVNHAGLASSDDGGRTWTTHADATWPGDSGFAQVAFAEEGGWLYAMGIPEGRFGSARVARVRPIDVLHLDRWRYWDGTRWQAQHALATPVVPFPVGELSIRWSETYERWLMLYLDEAEQAVVMRTARQPQGPWTAEEVVVTAAEQPTLYAPYLVPTGPDGPDVYFTLSRYDTYGVYLWRANLGPPADARALADDLP